MLQIIVHNTVSVINTATNTVSATIPLVTSPDGVSVSPDGSNVYVTNQCSNTCECNKYRYQFCFGYNYDWC